jgi:hypothetical protein
MMNRVTSGVTRFGSGLGTMNRNAQQSNRFLQAMSTTLRYAFAGRVIYGIQNAVNNLAEFKTQLGEIDALAGRIDQQGKFHGLGGQLDELGKQALLMSNRFGIAVPEVESYMQRFYTSFKPKGSAQQQAKEMTDFVNAHLELVTMLGGRGGDPNVLAGGLAGLIRSMPGGEKQAGKNAQILSNYFAKIITGSPNLTGQDIATSAGRLASAKVLSGMSIRDVLSVYGLAAQTGGSSAVITRGVTQLLGSSLLHPTKPESLSTYRMAGLPTDPNALRDLGGTNVLEKLIQFANPTGQKGAVNKINLNAIYSMFSRQESVRQFVSLLANGGVPALKNFQKSLDDTAKNNVVHQRAQARLDQSLLIRMRVATSNFGLSLVQGADPVLEYGLARPLIYASNLAIRHPKITQAAVGTGLTIGAVAALRRLGAFNKLGGLGRFGKFISGASDLERAAIGGAIAKEELPSAIAGTAGDGSRASPFWVVIAPLSWQLGQPGGAFNPNNKEPGSPGGGPSIFTRAKGFVRKFPVVVAPALPILADAAPPVAGLAAGFAFGKYVIGHGQNWSQLRKQGYTQSQILRARESVPAAYRTPLLNALELSQLGPKQLQTIKFEGNPKADLTIKLVDAQGRTISIQEHKGVPILPKAKTFPSAQGKAGSRKGGT